MSRASSSEGIAVDILANVNSELDSMNKSLSLTFGFLLWAIVMWDGFSTIVLPRTVAPMKRLSGRFYKRSWYFWVADRPEDPLERATRWSFPRRLRPPLGDAAACHLGEPGDPSRFALIYQGLGARFEEDRMCQSAFGHRSST